jgi:polyisoprenoid-binding protein YceI
MRLRKTILGVAIAMLFAIPFLVGHVTTRSVDAMTRDTKVNYLPIPAGDYALDPAHSVIGFAIRHLEINWVEGRFKDFKGTIHFDDKDVTKSSVEFTAKIDSVDTGVEARNNHLKTADFFEAQKFPEMTFKSTGVERKGASSYVLRGDLTLKGVTKPVALPFSITGGVNDPWGNIRFGIEAHTKINRRDFGVNYGVALPTGGFDVGNEVTINLQLEALKPVAKQ